MSLPKPLFAFVQFLLISVFAAGAAQAQALVGQCNDTVRAQSFAFYSNNYTHQIGNPANNGYVMRDPSFSTFLRVPAANPALNAYFVGWDGSLIEITQGVGARVIGGCQFHPGYVQANPYANVFQPPVMSQNMVVEVPGGGEMPIPQAIVQSDRPFGVPMIASEARAVQCWNSAGGSQSQFGDCMVRAMAGQRERAAYDCARANRNNNSAMALCMVGALGGAKERQVAQTLANCQAQYGTRYSEYPLCMAGQNIDGDTGKLLQCVQQQTSQGQVSVMGTAMCYGAGKLDMNTEMQIAVQCAVSSGGEPMTFAGCAGGQLTAIELNKCFTNGVGGAGGCFGPNNTIVQALQSAGQAIGQHFGPNNDLVKTWNNAVHDVTQGPGPNNEVVKVFRNVGNEVKNAPQNVVNAVKRVVPKIKIKF
jgi:hypothetical protein